MRLGTLAAALLAAAILTPAHSRADGGALIFREARDTLVVSLFAAPTPLRAGPAVLEVLVQARATGEPLLAADVRLRIAGPAQAEPFEVQTGPDHRGGGNRLFHAAEVELPFSGRWQVEVLVAAPVGREAFRANLDVAPAAGPVRRYAAYFAATLVGVGVLVLHQALRLAGRRRQTA